MQLHRLARAYSTDPASVLAWDPFRVALAVAALQQADAHRADRVSRQDGLMPVLDLGGEW